MLIKRDSLYIDGKWVSPIEHKAIAVTNPATEQVMYEVALGSGKDVDVAVRAARRAFETFSKTTRAERLELLQAITSVYRSRMKDIAQAITEEMGAPSLLAEKEQAAIGIAHLKTTIEVLRTYEFEEECGRATLTREPIGVVGMISPWNWPMNQIVCKVAPALAAGCAMILKPSEFTPSSALLFAEVMHEAGVPAGVFNMINGLGPEVGVAMSEHPGIDMISFTGSTRAGIDVAKRAADSVKRVSQELGGKSPNIILDCADFQRAVTNGVENAFKNSGQTCNAPTRMIVPASRLAEVEAIAKEVADRVSVGDPRAAETTMGPVVNRAQWEKIQGLVAQGIDEGAKLIAGGTGLPSGLEKGFFVRPTIFSEVKGNMKIATEEIFGPVLVIQAAEDETAAIRVANDTPYGLGAYVWAGSLEKARSVSKQIRAGNVNINGAINEISAPFGGVGRSGNGREWGKFGLEEFLEVKAIVGYAPT